VVGNASIENVVARRAVFVILSSTSDNRSCLTSVIDSLDVDFTLWVNKVEKFRRNSRDGVMLVGDKLEGVVELDGISKESVAT
jgi:hypothetical protein